MNAIGDALLHPGDAAFGPKVEAIDRLQLEPGGGGAGFGASRGGFCT